MTHVPIPGREPGTPSAGVPKAAGPRRSRRAGGTRRFYVALVSLVLGMVGTVVLGLGQPVHLSPETTNATVRAVAGLTVALLVVVPAFGFFRYEKAAAGGAWHEPVWRPTLLGVVSLFVALGVTVGWHGLRLAFFIARLWTGGAI